MLELEKEKKDLEARIAHEEIVTPKVTREQVVFWLNQFKGGDIDDPEYQRLIIDVFVKAVFVYDDHITITYNYIDESGRPRTVNIEDSGFPTDPVKGSTLKSNPPPLIRPRNLNTQRFRGFCFLILFASEARKQTKWISIENCKSKHFWS